MTHLVLPDKIKERIAHELSTVPAVQGKYVLTIETSCGSGGTLNSVKVKRYTEDEMRTGV